MLAIFWALWEDSDFSRKSRGRNPSSRNRGNGRRTGSNSRRGDGKRGMEEMSGSADIQMGIATLASLRLLIKMGAANAGDAIDGGCRYRVAVGWEVVRGIGRSVGVEVEDYLAD